MKRLVAIILCGLVLGLFGTVASAQDAGKKADSKVSEKEHKGTVKKAGKIFNTVCPVMGDKLDKDAIPFVYKDKTYGLCCKRCVKKMEKDPEKYIRNLSEDGTKFLKK